MRKITYVTIAIFLVLALTLGVLSFDVFARPLALGISPNLGLATSFSVLGHTTVTNTGPTSMPGDLGVDGGAVSDLGTLTVGGMIYESTATEADNAQSANTAAFGVLDQTCDTTWPGSVVELGGRTLVPGVYCADSFGLTGTLTLNGGPGDVFIFKAASTLVTASGSSVVGGDPCNIWWRVGSSATLNTRTSFIGNILALTDIGLLTNASLNGRAMVQTGQVTLDTNVFTGPVCAQQVTTTAETTTTVVPGLPGTGGAPIRNAAFPWSMVILGGFSAIALILGIRAYRSIYRSK